MSDADDLKGVAEQLIPNELAEQLLSGRAIGASATPQIAAVASVLDAARQPPEPAELAGMDAALQMFRAERSVATSSTPTPAARRRPMIARVVMGKTLAIGAVTLLSAGVAAAATDHLPRPFAGSSPTIAATETTGAASTTIEGSMIIDPVETSSTVVESGTTAAAAAAPGTTATSESATPAAPGPAPGETVPASSAAPTGPDATGPAAVGLCTAYQAQARNGGGGASIDAVAFQALAAAATSNGQSVDAYCAQVVAGAKPSSDGKAATAPGATAPGRPTTTTTAPAAPASTAPPASSAPDTTAPVDHGRSGDAPGHATTTTPDPAATTIVPTDGNGKSANAPGRATAPTETPAADDAQAGESHGKGNDGVPGRAETASS